MPYIPEKDRPALDPLIESLNNKVIALIQRAEVDAEDAEFVAWGYMRYIALKVLEQAALNAAEQYQGKRGTRYWLIVDHNGIAMNIALELLDRVRTCGPELSPCCFFLDATPEEMVPPIPEDAFSLDPEINALVYAISEIAGPAGYNYDGAYCGMVNYSMTELMPRIMLAVKGECIDWDDIDNLIIFWISIGREIYSRIARGYEDEQIVKSGDIKAYRMLLERLRN